MDFREYTFDDYDQVKELVKECNCGEVPPKYEFGGIAYVMEDHGVIHGFTWALISGVSIVAFIDYFAVSKQAQGPEHYGAQLIMHLIKELTERGITKIVGVIIKNGEHSDGIMRIYGNMGMSMKDCYFMSGNSQTILDGLKKHYPGK